MAISTNGNKNVVAFLTNNLKLCSGLQAALEPMVVIKVENIDAVNNSVKHNSVGAVVLHVTSYNSWIIFELLKTGYPDIPRFAILAPSLSGEDYNHDALANKYGAAAITTEKGGIKSLATLIQVELAKQSISDSTSKESFMNIYGEMGREIERLLAEYRTMGMRTLPQPEIGDDSQERLKETLQNLKKITIKP